MREINPISYSTVSVDDVNRDAGLNPEKLIAQSESYYYTQLYNATTEIIAGEYRIILLSGPSASGKTTTAYKLKEEFIKRGVGARVLSMDDFFLGVDYYPLLDNGNPNMEAFETLDIDLLNSCLLNLLRDGKAEFPVFDFTTQSRSEDTQLVTLGHNHVLIMEGIHALNPEVLRDAKKEDVYRLYVSVRTKFQKDGKDIMRPQDLRLLRRMVRDSLFRNYSPINTIEYWRYVLESEKINIDPYRDAVNMKMDNTLDYEVCIWNFLLHDRLTEEDIENLKESDIMQKVIIGLEMFSNLPAEKIPEESLLREFIGESEISL